MDDLLYRVLARRQAALCSSWSVLAHVIRLNAKVLDHVVFPDATTPWRPLAKGFQNVAAPLHMSEALVGGYDIEERLPLSLKQNTTRETRETRDNLNGDPRGLDLFKTHPSTASTIMFLECRESMSSWETTREKARLRITRWATTAQDDSYASLRALTSTVNNPAFAGRLQPTARPVMGCITPAHSGSGI